MSIDALLSTIVLVSFLVTIVLAMGSYLAYRVREHRRPPRSAAPPPDEWLFFERLDDDDPPDRQPHG